MPSVSRPEGALKAVSAHLPDECVERLDGLVRAGLFPSRSEALRAAVRELLKKAWRRMPLGKP
jgi:Arc/MetJ-type ribon-helix-helix transcriptional regulator